MLETQVRELAKQLPPEQQVELAIELLLNQWDAWRRLSARGLDAVRKIAQARGLDWDALSEDERERLIDEILHEP